MGGPGGGSGGRVRMDVNEELKFLWKLKRNWGGGVGLRGVRLDVNVELKFFVKIQKKIYFLGGVGPGVVGDRVGGVRVDVNEELK